MDRINAAGFALPILVCLIATTALLSTYVWHDALLDARLKQAVQQGEARRRHTIGALISGGKVETTQHAALTTLSASAPPPNTTTTARLLVRSFPASQFARYSMLKLNALQNPAPPNNVPPNTAPPNTALTCPGNQKPQANSRESNFTCTPPLPAGAQVALRGNLYWDGALTVADETERAVVGGSVSGASLNIGHSMAIIAVGDITIGSLQSAAGAAGSRIALASVLGTVRLSAISPGVNFCVSAQAAELPPNVPLTPCAASGLLPQHSAVPLALRFGEID